MAQIAAIAGASSGIGAATARALVGDGFRGVRGARRLERLEEVAAEIHRCAVADAASRDTRLSRRIVAQPTTSSDGRILTRRGGGGMLAFPVPHTRRKR
jgi:NADP-dependent 3-hydroxy acid dehydrogenase YdfG